MFTDVSPELFLNAYAQGIFPMAEDAEDAHYNFYSPEKRALLPILDLHISKSLLKKVKQQPFEIKIDTDFEGVIAACGDNYKGRMSTWINAPIRQTFMQLHELGYAHSVECWDNNDLVGGLYGLAIGQVFCGESMFSRQTDASKIALVHLCARLHMGGFEILDSQFINDHLKQFGVYEILQEKYVQDIQKKMKEPADFNLADKNVREILERYLALRKN